MSSGAMRLAGGSLALVKMSGPECVCVAQTMTFCPGMPTRSATSARTGLVISSSGAYSRSTETIATVLAPSQRTRALA